MRILITGVAGFAGAALARRLVDAEMTSGTEIHGILHRHDWRIRDLSSRLHLHKGDLRNATWVLDLIQKVAPTHLIHLAAWSDVGGSWEHPWSAYELNIGCQLNLLEALRRFAPACRTVIVASSEVYGRVQADDIPIDEETPFRPISPYGVSKIAQDMMGLQYWQSSGLPILRARPFNHLGPGQADDFVASSFARQIAEIEAGQKPPRLFVGNLEAVRDYSDVRDIVAAYWTIARDGEPGQVYNVGSGEGRTPGWILETLLSLSSVEIEVVPDPGRMRPSEVPISICDNQRLASLGGWRPQYDLPSSLRDVLDYWREGYDR